MDGTLLPHSITYLLLSGVGDSSVVGTTPPDGTVRAFEQLADATAGLTAAVLLLTLILLVFSLIALLFLMLATVRWPGPRW